MRRMEAMKRFLSLLLCVVMVIGMLPVNAFANDAETTGETVAETTEETVVETTEEAVVETTEETVAETTEEAVVETTEETVVETTEETVTETTEETVEDDAEEPVQPVLSEPVTYQPDVEGFPTDEELFAYYANGELYGTSISTYGRKVRDSLSGNLALTYDALVPVIHDIAGGKRASTSVTIGIPLDGYPVDVEVPFTGVQEEEFLSILLGALLSDMPFYMYWYNKTSPNTSMQTLTNSADGSLLQVILRFPVAGNYAGSDIYTANTEKTGAASSAAATALEVATTDVAGKTDYEKLVYFKDYICGQVVYNDAAADGEVNYADNDDPWQLIYVFDGNASTNVVCEGYSKAFQYLCDLTTFANSTIECYSVTGYANGPHMWNIVSIDGNNYMADVTNTDVHPNSAKYNFGQMDNCLFLTGNASGSIADGYTFTNSNGNTLTYLYSYTDEYGSLVQDALEIFGTDSDSILKLAAANYDPTDAGKDTSGKLTQEAFSSAMVGTAADGRYALTSSVDIAYSMELTSTVMVSNATLTVKSGAVLTVPSGTDLVALGENSKIVVEAGGQLVNAGQLVADGGSISVTHGENISGYVHEEGALLVAHYGLDPLSICPITGIDTNLQILRGGFATQEHLKALLAEAENYQTLDISLVQSLTLTEDLTLPENAELRMDGADSAVVLTVPAGLTLKNLGKLSLGNAKLVVEAQSETVQAGAIINEGKIMTDPGKAAQIEINGSFSNIGSVEQDKGITLNNATMTIGGTFENGENSSLMINSGSGVTVSAGSTMTNSGSVHVGFHENGALDVQGTMENYGYLNIPYGTGTVTVSGTLKVLGRGFVQLDGSMTVKSSGTLNIDLTNAGDGGVLVNPTGNLTVEEGASVSDSVGYADNAVLTGRWLDNQDDCWFENDGEFDEWIAKGMSAIENRCVIFYLQTWNAETQTWDAIPVVPTENSEYLSITQLTEGIGEDEENGAYFVQVESTGTLSYQKTALTVEHDGKSYSFDFEIFDRLMCFSTTDSAAASTALPSGTTVALDAEKDENAVYLLVTQPEVFTVSEFKYSVNTWGEDYNNFVPAGETFVTCLTNNQGLYKFVIHPDYVNYVRCDWKNFCLQYSCVLTNADGSVQQKMEGDIWVNPPEEMRKPDAVLHINGVDYQIYQDPNLIFAELYDSTSGEWGRQQASLPTGISYDISNNTLTLENVTTLNTLHLDGNALPSKELVLNLIGTNAIDCNYDSALNIHGGLHVTVTSEQAASLALSTTNNYNTDDEGNPYAFSTVSMDNGSGLTIGGNAAVTARNQGMGQHDNGEDAWIHAICGDHEGSTSLEVKDSASLIVSLPEGVYRNDATDNYGGGYSGIEGVKDITVSGNAKLTADMIYLKEGYSFTQTGGEVTINSAGFNWYNDDGTLWYCYEGIVAESGTVDISGGILNIHTVPAETEMPTGTIQSIKLLGSSTMNLSGGEVTLNNGGAMGCNLVVSDESQLNMTGGKLDISSADNILRQTLSIQSEASASFLGGTIQADYALLLWSGNVTWGKTNEGSTVPASGTVLTGTPMAIRSCGPGSFKMYGGSITMTGVEGVPVHTEEDCRVYFAAEGPGELFGGSININNGAFFNEMNMGLSGGAIKVSNTWADTVGMEINQYMPINSGTLEVTTAGGPSVVVNGTYHQMGGTVTIEDTNRANEGNQPNDAALMSMGTTLLNGGTMNLKGYNAFVQAYDAERAGEGQQFLAQVIGGKLNIEATHVGLMANGMVHLTNNADIEITASAPCGDDKSTWPYGIAVIDSSGAGAAKLLVEGNAKVNLTSVDTANHAMSSKGIALWYAPMHISGGTVTIDSEMAIYSLSEEENEDNLNAEFINFAVGDTNMTLTTKSFAEWGMPGTGYLHTLATEAEDGTITYIGDVTITVNPMTQEALESMLSSGEDVRLDVPVTLTEDLTIDMGDKQLSVVQGGMLTVTDGVTLTLKGIVNLPGGTIKTESGGKTVVAEGCRLEVDGGLVYTGPGGELTVEQGGVLNMPGGRIEVQAGGVLKNSGSIYTSGEMIVAENAYVNVTDSAFVRTYFYGSNLYRVEGVPYSNLELEGGIWEDGHLTFLLEEAAKGYRHVRIMPNSGNYTIAEDLTVPENVELIYGDSEINIAKDKTLTVNGKVTVKNSALNVNDGGKLVTAGPFRICDCTIVTVCGGGQMTIAGDQVYVENESQLTVHEGGLLTNNSGIQNDGSIYVVNEENYIQAEGAYLNGNEINSDVDEGPYLALGWLADDGSGWYENGDTGRDLNIPVDGDRWIIFYRVEWNQEGFCWMRIPVDPASITMTNSDNTQTPYLTMTKVQNMEGSQIREGEANGAYFVRVTAVDGWDKSVKLSYTPGGTQLLASEMTVSISREESGFYKTTTLDNANWLNGLVVNPFRDNVFYFGFSSEHWTLNSVELQDHCADMGIVEKVSENVYKCTLNAATAAKIWESNGYNFAVTANVTLKDDPTRTENWNCDLWCQAPDLGRSDAKIVIDDHDYLYLHDAGGFIKCGPETNYREVVADLPEGVSYDYTSNTLTLENANLSSLSLNGDSWTDDEGNEYKDLPNRNLTIALKGNNKIVSDHDGTLNLNGLNVTITSSSGGVLNLKSVNDNNTYEDEEGVTHHYAFDTVNVNGSLTIAGNAVVNAEIEGSGTQETEDGSSTETAMLSALRVNEGSLTLKDSAKLTTIVPEGARHNGIITESGNDAGGYHGIENVRSVTVRDNAVLNTQQLDIHYEGGTYTQTGGTVTITALGSYDRRNNEETSEEQDIIRYHGINVGNGNIAISGGTLDVYVQSGSEDQPAGYAEPEFSGITTDSGTITIGGSVVVTVHGTGSGSALAVHDAGTLNLIGGTLNYAGSQIAEEITNETDIPGEAIMLGEDAVMNLTGTAVNISDAVVNANGFVKMTGGSLNLTRGTFHMGKGMNQSGGTVKLENGYAEVCGNDQYTAALNLSKKASFTLTNTVTENNTTDENIWAVLFRVHPSAALNVTGGTLNVTGSGYDVLLEVNGAYSQSGGTVTVTETSETKQAMAMTLANGADITGGTLAADGYLALSLQCNTGGTDENGNTYEGITKPGAKLTMSGGNMLLNGVWGGMGLLLPAEISGGKVTVHASGEVMNNPATGKTGPVGIGIQIVPSAYNHVTGGGLTISGGEVTVTAPSEIPNGCDAVYGAGIFASYSKLNITGGRLSLTGTEALGGETVGEDQVADAVAITIGEGMHVISTADGSIAKKVSTPGEKTTDDGVQTWITESYQVNGETVADMRIESSSCGDNVAWSFDAQTGTLNITGTGAMKDYASAAQVPWYSIRSQIKRAVLGGEITGIGAYAFAGCSNMTIEIGEQIAAIGENAFQGCAGEKMTAYHNSGDYLNSNGFTNVKYIGTHVLTDQDGTLTCFCGYTDTQVQTQMAEKLTELENNAAEGETVTVSQKVEAIKEVVDTESIKTALVHTTKGEQSNAVADMIVNLEEEAKQETNKTVSVAVPEATDEKITAVFNTNTVTESDIVGALLNADTAETAPDKVELVISNPDANTSVDPEKYETDNAVVFSMTLEGVTSSENLTVPVKLTLPVPAGMDTEKLVILHYHGDGDPVEVDYELSQDKTSVSFVLTGFSDFAFVEEAERDEEPVEQPSGIITDTGRSLSLNGIVYINQYVKVEGFDGVNISANGGMLIWRSAVEESEAVYGNQEEIRTGLVLRGDEYAQQISIPACEYADTLYLRIYIRDAEGNYVYGPLKSYSVREYCENKLVNASNEKLKDTCAALLHYGAAAQVYFNHRTEDLADKNVTRQIADYSDALLDTPMAPITLIQGTGLVKDNGKSLSLDAAVGVNFYFKLDASVGKPETAELLFWENVSGELTLNNVAYTKPLKDFTTEYGAQSEMVPARYLGNPVYACAHFIDSEGTHHYSDIIVYSPEAYAARKISANQDQNLVNVVKAMVLYGELADEYFVSTKNN